MDFLQNRRKMTEKSCRLCFEKKLKSIGIFTRKGVKLNIARTVRVHFPDEVNGILMISIRI